MKQLLLGFLFSFSFLLLTTCYLLPKAHAADNFLTNYNVTYTIDESGVTHGKFDIALTNATSQYYASSYKIAVGFADITNIKATDPNGQLTPTIIKTADGYTLELQFNKKVVGEGNKLPFTITFDTSNVAEKLGNIWEVNIPGIANQSDFSAFSVTVKVPDSFGTPAYIKPQHTGSDLVFSKEELGKSGIALAFGEKQTYKFNLVYHLRNKNVFPLSTEIALPPSTNYQEVAIDSMEPRPSNVIRDADGNWLAQYRLLPSQKIDVKVKGRVQLSLTPKEESLPEQQKKLYLADKPYWQASSSEIKKLTKQLKTPEAIYQYVVKTLIYDYSRVAGNQERLGGVEVFKQPQSAICVEFTDLFITLARAAGIPAREIDGYGFTKNTRQRPLSLEEDTLLHAWPEYYDTSKKTWIMIDPTWANTTGGVDYFHTLDFDHIAFVIKGMDSTYPIYAGGYKYDDAKTKDVDVTFSPTFGEHEQHIELYTDLPAQFLSGLPMDGKLVVKNVGNTAVSSRVATISSPKLRPLKTTIAIDQIPPFGFIERQLSFGRTPFLTNGVYPFTITLSETQINRTITVTPFIINTVTVSGGIILAILIIVLLIITFKTRRLPVSR
ncbi:hypothetical protein BH11PAT1_BH11PAT1_3620 [soil metagenome]